VDLKLAGRSALVTGGSKGIGKAIAEVLAGEGVALHLAARDEDVLRATATQIADSYAVKTEIHALDLSVADNARVLVERCKDVDILVNNAGAIPAGLIGGIDDAQWREAWDLKVFGYINMCRGMLAHMTERRHGVILNVLGSAGERPDAKYIAGSMGNASLSTFTKTLGGVSVDDNVRVLGVNPGRIATGRMETQLRRRAVIDYDDPERWQEYIKDLPFGRAGRAEEVGQLVAFLVSDLAAYISGTVVTIDGGAVMRP
jgi:3-oxoacyl-[acyl-carrier protein] reductase